MKKMPSLLLLVLSLVVVLPAAAETATEAVEMPEVVDLETLFGGGQSPSLMSGCYISCGGQMVDCTCTTSSCSAIGSTLTCNGHVTTCSEINAWDSCVDNCRAERDACGVACGFDFGCYGQCQDEYLSCFLGCGSNPAGNTCS
jgi:hypothetical protein